jgi:hypothetical protein
LECHAVSATSVCDSSERLRANADNRCKNIEVEIMISAWFQNNAKTEFLYSHRIPGLICLQ